MVQNAVVVEVLTQIFQTIIAAAEIDEVIIGLIAIFDITPDACTKVDDCVIPCEVKDEAIVPFPTCHHIVTRTACTLSPPHATSR